MNPATSLAPNYQEAADYLGPLFWSGCFSRIFLAAVMAPAGVRRVLESLGLPIEAPRLWPARPPPQMELEQKGSESDDSYPAQPSAHRACLRAPESASTQDTHPPHGCLALLRRARRHLASLAWRVGRADHVVRTRWSTPASLA